MNDNPELNDLPIFPNDGPIFDYMISIVFPRDIESGPLYKILKNAESKVQFQNIYDATNVQYSFSKFTHALSKIKREYDRICSNYEMIQYLYEKYPELMNNNFGFLFIYEFDKGVDSYLKGINSKYTVYMLYKTLCKDIKELINTDSRLPMYKTQLSDICRNIDIWTDKWDSMTDNIQYYLISDTHKKEYLRMKEKLSELDMYDELFS